MRERRVGNRLNLTNSKLSFIHVGLPLDHPSIPIEIRKEASVQLPQLRARMQAEAYGYELVFASPEDSLENFKSQLGACEPDGVVIGGGVVGNLKCASSWSRSLM